MSYEHLQRRLEARGQEPARFGEILDEYSFLLRRQTAAARIRKVNEIDALFGLENGNLRAHFGRDVSLDVKDYKH